MRLPEGYGTYLDRPVRDYYTALPEGTKTIFGREVDYGRIRGMGGMSSTTSINLSGGQLQRIALYVRSYALLAGCLNDTCIEIPELYAFRALRLSGWSAAVRRTFSSSRSHGRIWQVLYTLFTFPGSPDCARRRSFRTAAPTPRQQDDGLQLTSFRQPNTSRRPHPVRRGPVPGHLWRF